MVQYQAHKRPAYAIRAGLNHTAFCRNCRKSRFVSLRSEPKPCNGGGPYQEVTCGSCGDDFMDFAQSGCRHEAGDPNCLVWQRAK